MAVSRAVLDAVTHSRVYMSPMTTATTTPNTRAIQLAVASPSTSASFPVSAVRPPAAR